MFQIGALRVLLKCIHFAIFEPAKFSAVNKRIINKWINGDLEVAHPQSGSLSTSFLVELEFGNVGFWGEGKTGVPGEKPLGAKERTNNKLNPHMASTLGFEPEPHWWEASALTTAPSLAPQHLWCHIVTVLFYRFVFQYLKTLIISSMVGGTLFLVKDLPSKCQIWISLH